MKLVRTFFIFALATVALGGVVVHAASPTAEFEVVDIDDLTLTFDPSASEDVDGDIDEYRWRFGESGDPGTNAFAPVEVEHTFADYGTYTVSLEVVDAEGNSDTYQEEIEVSEPLERSCTPQASFAFNPSFPEVGERVTFLTSSVARCGRVLVSHTWHTGEIDATPEGSGAQFGTIFPAEGEYAIHLIATDNQGDTDSTRRYLYVGSAGGETDNADMDDFGDGVQSLEYDPATDYGSGGLVPCDGINCGFNDFIELLNKVITWIFYTAMSVATIMFAYAGWLYMSAQGSEQKISTAHNIFKKTAIGLIIIAVAWLIVNTLTSALLDTNNGFWTILK